MTTTIETQTLALCECCAFLIANGDESGCRHYYNHTHKSADVPFGTVLTDETDQPTRGFTCNGCDEEQGRFAYRLWAVVLEAKHSHIYSGEIADWWCEDCQTVTDFCEQN